MPMTVQAHDDLRSIDLKDPDIYVPGVPHEIFSWLRAT